MRTNAVLALGLVGCGILDDTGSVEDGIYSAQSSMTSNAQGLVGVEVEVKDGMESFLVTGASADWMALEAIEDPDGDVAFDWQDWADEDRSLTGAMYASARDVVVNWPVREQDDALHAGTWTVWLATIDNRGYYDSGVDVDLVVQRKADGDLGDGTVEVLIVWAEGVGGDAAVVEATERAVDRWAEVWGAYGAGIDVEYVDAGIDADLPAPYEGDEDIADVSSLGSTKDVTVIIGETIEGSYDYYGIAGSIPGTLVNSERSAVVISWLANAGGDGSFSDDDVRLYGETLAHEVGHYTGLFHPVEMTWDWYDALDDTEECTSANRCEGALGDNLMFPYPICGWSSCDPQDVLTPDQGGVMQRYTGTL